jgi:serine/threonine protein kinase
MISFASLLDALRHGPLLPDGRLAEAESLTRSLPSPQAVVAELQKRSWLTEYQGQELCQGNGMALALGPYVLLEKLGEGGMGEVFKARHRFMGREAALKCIHRGLMGRPEFVKRFLREGRAVAQLSHRHVVQIHDVNEANGRYFLAMEYLRGVNLAEHLSRRGWLPASEAAEYVRQACEGMQHAHEKGLVHRDLKPANLMLADSGLIKVLDLGLARLATDDGLTETGQFFGTPEFAAPEQMEDFKQASFPADVYSLGCVLYRALAGRPPFLFKGVSWEKRLRIIQHEEPRPIEEFRDSVPPRLCEVVRRMLAKRAAERYQTAGQAAAALAAFLHGQQADGVSVGPDQSSPETEKPAPVEAPQDTTWKSPAAAKQKWPASFVNSVGMTFVLVGPGRFLMGSPPDEDGRSSDELQHEVTITRPFYLGVHPVTQGQWKAVMGRNPSWFSRTGEGKDGVKEVSDAELDRLPVECVSWEEAAAFLKKLSAWNAEARRGREYRLPSEAEWEYACRGGHLIDDNWQTHVLPFHFDRPASALSSAQANFNGNLPHGGAPRGPNLQRTCKVGSYPANRLGLFDVHGNVCEWCADWYGPYPPSPASDPVGPPQGSERVYRGGGYFVHGRYCRAAYRGTLSPSVRNQELGFRAAAVLASG